MWSTISLIFGIATLVAANLDATHKDLSNFTDVEFYYTPLTRVINGQEAQRRQLPWHAVIEIISSNGMTRVCAGSLISSTFVLTEANALRGSNQFEVVLGSHWNSERRVAIRSSTRHLHPSHRPGNGNFNIGLLELDRAFTAFTKYIRPVQLVDASTVYEYEGRYVWISGFGSSTSQQFTALQWATVRVLPLDECRSTFPGVEENVLCTIGHDSYHAGPGVGDGGAPLVALERGLYVQIGVYAFSWRNDFTRPVGYINIADPAIRRWIRSVSRV